MADCSSDGIVLLLAAFPLRPLSTETVHQLQALLDGNDDLCCACVSTLYVCLASVSYAPSGWSYSFAAGGTVAAEPEAARAFLNLDAHIKSVVPSGVDQTLPVPRLAQGNAGTRRPSHRTNVLRHRSSTHCDGGSCGGRVAAEQQQPQQRYENRRSVLLALVPRSPEGPREIWIVKAAGPQNSMRPAMVAEGAMRRWREGGDTTMVSHAYVPAKHQR